MSGYTLYDLRQMFDNFGRLPPSVLTRKYPHPGQKQLRRSMSRHLSEYDPKVFIKLYIFLINVNDFKVSRMKITLFKVKEFFKEIIP